MSPLAVKYAGKLALVGLLAITLSACAGMTRKQQNTALGAAAGAAVGNIIWGGPGATLGAAALGAAIGSQGQ